MRASWLQGKEMGDTIREITDFWRYYQTIREIA